MNPKVTRLETHQRQVTWSFGPQNQACQKEKSLRHSPVKAPPRRGPRTEENPKTAPKHLQYNGWSDKIRGSLNIAVRTQRVWADLPNELSRQWWIVHWRKLTPYVSKRNMAWFTVHLLPAAPIPATARPKIKKFTLGATPQNNDPISNHVTAAILLYGWADV